ncbi:mannan endo-1,4-beta-mannosidase 1-like [Hibiscus syriacus]|uniref:mannan endo-1,4-beta-mannosidase 1-like n=1 Tax=Hibiscus syriacus TaxID=106335 RepID=UPI001923DC1B|nr:mannan endo-1,4-beta-mannosidase 1-like [Hibiscus syriacus]
MFQGLDFVVSEAKRYGIKLVLSFANNYDQFGGKKQYVNWARNQGQSIGPADDFFTNSVVKEYYKNHINTVLIRRNTLTGVAYKDEPTIMAWELMNEPRCLSDPSGNTMQVSCISSSSCFASLLLCFGFNFQKIYLFSSFFSLLNLMPMVPVGAFCGLMHDPL